MNLFFLYEPGHADVLERFLKDHPDKKDRAVIAAFDVATEMRLADKHIPFVSGYDFFAKDMERFLIADEWPTALFRSNAWAWFSYRDVPLYEVFLHPMQMHILTLMHWTAAADNLLARFPAERLYVFESLQDLPLKGRPLTRELHNAVVDCAQLAGKHRGAEVIVVPRPAGARMVTGQERLFFALEQKLLGMAAALLNFATALLPRKRQAPRILVTDYWRNIKGLVEALPAAEILLFDRREIRNASMGDILRMRMRLYNFGSFSINATRAARDSAARGFRERWTADAESLLLECSYKDISLKPILRNTLAEIVCNLAPQALADIDSAYALLGRTKPTLVLLRASISMQTHFAILALVSQALTIPSLELQHGLEHLGPGSLSKRHLAEYIAVYGIAVQDELAALGFARDKLPIIGSPRFDAYAHYLPEAPKHKNFTVLCMTSHTENDGSFSGYDARAYFEGVAGALERIPGASVLIKMRPGPELRGWYWHMIDKTFARVPHAFVQNEPFAELLPQVDAVVSHFSTAVLESLQCGKPLILFGLFAQERQAIRCHFTRYLDEGAVMIALSPEALLQNLRELQSSAPLREQMSQQAQTSVRHFNAFDGHSSERIVALLADLK